MRAVLFASSGAAQWKDGKGFAASKPAHTFIEESEGDDEADADCPGVRPAAQSRIELSKCIDFGRPPGF